MDNKDVVHTCSGILLSRKKKIMPSAATCMDREIVTSSQVRKRKTIIWYHLYVKSKRWLQMNLSTKQK